MNEIYVIGHHNPDTDSIVSAMAYAALRNALEMLHEEQAALFGGSLAQWLRARE